jgi:hypothetical protein
MPRISIDAIDTYRAKAMAQFSPRDTWDWIEKLYEEWVELEGASATWRHEAKSSSGGLAGSTSKERLPTRRVGMGAMMMKALRRTGDPVWFVVAEGIASQSLMSASFEFSTATGAGASCRPNALTKSRVN